MVPGARRNEVRVEWIHASEMKKANYDRSFSSTTTVEMDDGYHRRISSHHRPSTPKDRKKTVERPHTRRSFDRSFEDRSWTDGTRSIPRRGSRFDRGGERGESLCPVVVHGRSAFGTSTKGLRARFATMRFMVGTVRLIRTARVPGWCRISLNNS